MKCFLILELAVLSNKIREQNTVNNEFFTVFLLLSANFWKYLLIKNKSRHFEIKENNVLLNLLKYLYIIPTI